MQLTSAQDLKAQLLNDVVVPFTRVAAASARGARSRSRAPGAALARELAVASPLAVSATPGESLPDVQRSVALGVTLKGKQYQLAVRVQRQGLMASPLVEHLVSQAKGEADVRMVGRIDKRQIAGPPWNQGKVRPVMIGTSVGHPDVTAGTVGAFVTAGGKTFILSNNHVLANENLAKAGDRIVQPGTLDGGKSPKDAVARLRKFIALKVPGANFVDAAIAELDAGVSFDRSLMRGLVGGADRTLSGLGPAFVDESTPVFKLGRTTGATEGRVTAFDLDNVVVSYGIGNVRFDDQVEIEGTGNAPFSDGGDSGSIIVNGDMQAVALLFAGGDTGGTNGLGLTYANPIHRVLSDLKVTLLF
ncbi:MAG TPA: hypothetical protein VEX86_24960 [Longimicrobium sp.]|nr:hypothetical protein [Longimicrobium sp.]